MIKIECEVESSLEEDFDVIGKRDMIRVISHWNRNELVTLMVGKEKRTIDGDELIKAIENAMRTK